MARFEASTEEQASVILSSFPVPELKGLARKANDIRLSRGLAAKAAEYRARGNEEKAVICEARANAAFYRAMINA